MPDLLFSRQYLQENCNRLRLFTGVGGSWHAGDVPRWLAKVSLPRAGSVVGASHIIVPCNRAQSKHTDDLRRESSGEVPIGQRSRRKD